MKILAAIFLLCAALPMAGCDDKDARQYAQELVNVLDSYQEQVDRKVTAEKDSYKELAGVYERARQQNIEQTLEDERVERSEKLATVMVDADHLPRNTEILESLRAYAEEDFGSTRDFLQIEADAQAQFLGDIEALEFESETIDDLRASLKLLAKPKGNLKRIRDAAVFVQDTKKEFDQLLCKDVEAALELQQAQLAQLKTEVSQLSTQFGVLNDAVVKDQGKIIAVGQEIDIKNAEIDVLTKSIKATTEQKQGKCS
jgi:hypothetical protein